MSSQRQINANRRNAQNSTGPRTPEGRAAVRLNALRHGLTAKIAVLDNESAEQFEEMLAAFQSEHNPAGPTENLLVQQMVMAAWRLQRLRGIETGLFNMRRCDLKRDMESRYSKFEEIEARAFVFLDDTRNSGAIENLFRYETRIERSFYRALHELQRLRATAPPPPDQPTSQDVPPPAQPEPPVPLTESAEQTHYQDRTPTNPAPQASQSGAVPSGATTLTQYQPAGQVSALPGDFAGRVALIPAETQDAQASPNLIFLMNSSCLRFVQRESNPGHHTSRPIQCLHGATAAEDHEIIGVAHNLGLKSFTPSCDRLNMWQFLLFLCRQEAGLAPSRVAGVARDGRHAQDSPNGGDWVYIGR